jgi:hypothetical protein
MYDVTMKETSSSLHFFLVPSSLSQIIIEKMKVEEVIINEGSLFSLPLILLPLPYLIHSLIYFPNLFLLLLLLM